MSTASRILRSLAALCFVVVMVALDASAAYAQSRNCQTLANTLASIERSGDFRNLGDINDRTRDLERAVQKAESQYVRDGCNAAAKRGEKLSSQCRAEAIISALVSSLKPVTRRTRQNSIGLIPLRPEKARSTA